METAVGGYTVSITQNGITTVITNTNKTNPPAPDKPSQPNLPQTGVLWWPAALMTVLGVLLLLAALVWAGLNLWHEAHAEAAVE